MKEVMATELAAGRGKDDAGPCGRAVWECEVDAGKWVEYSEAISVRLEAAFAAAQPAPAWAGAAASLYDDGPAGGAVPVPARQGQSRQGRGVAANASLAAAEPDSEPELAAAGGFRFPRPYAAAGGAEEVAFERAGAEYVVRLERMAQLRVGTGAERCVRRRERPRPAAGYPPTWEGAEAQTENLRLVAVAEGSAEWAEVERRFATAAKKGKELLGVQRVQNKLLWRYYADQRARLGALRGAPLAEARLWHGTSRAEPRLLFNGEEGFDTRFSNKGYFGTGVYFAEKASYSCGSYAFAVPDAEDIGAAKAGPGRKAVLLAQVLTGEAYEMAAHATHRAEPNKPPRRPFAEEPSKAQYNPGRMGGQGDGGVARAVAPEVEGARYDSITGRTGGSKVWVIQGNGRAYPEYCVVFRNSS
jgi:hypothetical protein